MANHLGLISAIGSALIGLSFVVWRVFSGIADVKRANYDGKAKLIRAARGDPEPPIIVMPQPRLEPPPRVR